MHFSIFFLSARRKVIVFSSSLTLEFLLPHGFPPLSLPGHITFGPPLLEPVSGPFVGTVQCSALNAGNSGSCPWWSSRRCLLPSSWPHVPSPCFQTLHYSGWRRQHCPGPALGGSRRPRSWWGRWVSICRGLWISVSLAAPMRRQWTLKENVRGGVIFFVKKSKRIPGNFNFSHFPHGMIEYAPSFSDV